jgi:putative two-component system response regulator
MRHEVPRAPHVLVVDDHPGTASLLQTLLAGEGYTVEVAGDGREALGRAQRRIPDLVLLDLELPYLAGSEVCRRLKQLPATRLTPVVVITAQGGIHNKLAAWEFGADDFLTKPFYAAEVLARCRSLLRIKRLVEERDSAEAVVFALVRAVEAKSPYTHGHSERVQAYSLLLAHEVGLAESQQEVLRRGALLHDVGKISVPDAILNKPGPLTPEEFAVIRNHPVQGARIVESLHSVRDAVPLIRWHHERLDGRGYPDGLRGEEIPAVVRVLAVADVFDSVASERPYRGSMPLPKCLAVLEAGADDGALDPEFVAEFCAQMRGGAYAPGLPLPESEPVYAGAAG